VDGSLSDTLRALIGRQPVPLVAAPMTGVSGPDLVIACCRAGIMGSFPTTNAPADDVSGWLRTIDSALGASDAAYAVNLPLRLAGDRLEHDLDAVCASDAAAIIVSVGGPAPIVGPAHDADKAVIAVVATLHHARRAIASGCDGLVLLSAGAGGFTGWMNPFAFVRAVRAETDLPLVLAGGITDRVALDAAVVLGCDAAYLGTPLISAVESLASAEFRAAVVAAGIDDVELRLMPNGLRSNGTGDGDGFFTMGHSAHRADRVATVAELVASFTD
jgi:nitronate monooxygenase